MGDGNSGYFEGAKHSELDLARWGSTSHQASLTNGELN
jgi:hypothetical protein